MTYTYYIRKNNLTDSKETYAAYIKTQMPYLKDGMVAQQVNMTYNLRFA